MGNEGWLHTRPSLSLSSENIPSRENISQSLSFSPEFYEKLLKKALGKPTGSKSTSRLRCTSYLWALFKPLEIFPGKLWEVWILSKETVKSQIPLGTSFVSVLCWTKAYLVWFTQKEKHCQAARLLDLWEMQSITTAQLQDITRTAASSSRGWAGAELRDSPLSCARGQVNNAAVWAASCWHSNLSSISLVSLFLQTKV